MLDNSKRVQIVGKAIPLRGNDIDTDRIIPARYLKCVTFAGLGANAFYDERYDEDGNPKEHSFNDSKFESGTILFVNKNFGCGSSREHAPHALKDRGMKAIIGESYAEIFKGNCTSIGIPALTAREQDIEELMETVEKYPDIEFDLSVKDRTLCFNESVVKLEIAKSNWFVLTEGKWDSTAVLMENLPRIKETAEKIEYLNWK